MTTPKTWRERFHDDFPAMGVCGDPKDNCVYRFDQYVKDKSALESFIETIAQEERQAGRK